MFALRTTTLCLLDMGVFDQQMAASRDAYQKKFNCCLHVAPTPPQGCDVTLKLVETHLI